MSHVKKAIIPAAGLGTRFLPATKAIPKEMLPIVDVPTIQYIVEEAVQSGIYDLIIVTGRNKHSIENHFDYNHELEFNLEENDKEELLRIVRDVSNLIDIHYVRQKEPLGLGHAIWSARKFIGNEPFAVLLGDMIIDSEVPCLKQLIEIYDGKEASVIALQPVPWSEVHNYGVAEGTYLSSRLSSIDRLVEKPQVNAPSNYAIVGRYVLTPRIFDLIRGVAPGSGGEIQLTDALQQLIRYEPLLGYLYEGRLYDVGSKLGFLKANVEFALKREELHSEWRDYLQQLIGDLESESVGKIRITG
ncbi:UTP--glucose-1-phosphate uridylyltransferase GalU [Paenibacillus sp. J2TS4]|uniref:UTP--glucose-1-phosphate uridylyltransferase GalU n=1 Tax=Paenibacillus sp. J2TS4 TaxID=2807194 RepID=UPI001B22A0C6|nr:UTP--glucose-1-phosphate uridylyltransferase GalU [Paenibacillus sp. J2TS4]GIP36190.1 UTP--glucose-1-phosphate uridylyltransferase [Paenibacillus sp. J2TS4]